jgi:arylsulfatase A-like enzyme
MTNQPNIVYCMCDQMPWWLAGCYGHATIRTPHIDALAGRGLRFETAVSNNPVCMPARSIVLSGQYSRTCCGRLTNVVWRDDVPFYLAGFPQWPTGRRVHLPDPTLPELLGDAGYHTAAIGKWHIEAWPDAVGFDHYIIPAHHHAHSAQWFCEDGGPLFSPPGYSVDYESQRVEEYLNQRAGADDPFFLYYNISPPHMPIADAPARYKTMYGRDDVISRPNVPDDYQAPVERIKGYLWDYRYYRDHLPYATVPSADFGLLDMHAMFMGMVSWVDQAVGRMVAALEAARLSDQTVVVFTADHGDSLGSHGQLGKCTLNEESSRVPMCMAGPGITTGVNDGQVASLIDIAPTFLALAGREKPDHMAGADLGPILSGEREALERNFAFIETQNDGIGIRTPTCLVGLPFDKGTRSPRDQPHYLCDLQTNPYQMPKVQPELCNAQAARDLEAQLRAWDARTPWKQ